jgi:hypothetical protein
MTLNQASLALRVGAVELAPERSDVGSHVGQQSVGGIAQLVNEIQTCDARLGKATSTYKPVAGGSGSRVGEQVQAPLLVESQTVGRQPRGWTIAALVGERRVLVLTGPERAGAECGRHDGRDRCSQVLSVVRDQVRVQERVLNMCAWRSQTRLS